MENNISYFNTYDMYLSAVLVEKNFNLIKIQQDRDNPDRVQFFFLNSAVLNKIRTLYYNKNLIGPFTVQPYLLKEKIKFLQQEMKTVKKSTDGLIIYKES